MVNVLDTQGNYFCTSSIISDIMLFFTFYFSFFFIIVAKSFYMEQLKSYSTTPNK